MKKLSQGTNVPKALIEASGSFDSFLAALARAFSVLHFDPWVREVFDGYLIAYDSGLPSGQYWRIGWTVEQMPTGLRFSFQDKPGWEVVELDYVPAQPMIIPSLAAATGQAPPPAAVALPAESTPAAESKKPKGRGTRFTERTEQVRAAISEGTSERNKRLTISEAIVADRVNGNNRRYAAAVLSAAVTEISTQSKLRESVGQGRAILVTPDGSPVVGEADHPSDKGKRAQYLDTVVAWDSMTYDESTGAVTISGLIADTQNGRDILALAEIGVMPGGSLRGYGVSQVVNEDGRDIEEVVELHITGYDLVLTPSFANRHTSVIESTGDVDDMDPKKLIEMLGADPALAAQVKAALGIDDISKITEAQAAQWEARMRAALSLPADADLIGSIKQGLAAAAELAESKRQTAIDAAIVAGTTDLPFGPLNEAFVAAIKGHSFDTADQVGPFIEAKKTEYGAIASAAKLQGLGKVAGKTTVSPLGQVTVLGPVIESEGEAPEYAQAAHALSERIRQSKPTAFRPWKELAPANANQAFAAAYLKRFDESHRSALLAESRAFSEASMASDLALPNSINRAIIARAIPQLLITGMFKTGLMAARTEEWWYRAYQNETGVLLTVTAELVPIPASLVGGVEFTLGKQRLVKGTVVLTNNAANVTYTENVDYMIDYANGKMFIPAANPGSIPTSASAKITYNYEAVRKGEDATIERGKTVLTSKTMTAKADRLAQKITQEAMKFGRAALGMDIAIETLADLTFEIRRKIDSGVMHKAMYAARTVVSNTVGPYDISDGVADVAKVQLLVNYLGSARQKIANRYYEPEGILVSGNMADHLANWAGFTQAGSRGDAALGLNGYAGSVKGLPVFHTTEIDDNAGLVFNSELAGYFVFSPLELKGPFPTYADDSDGQGLKLVADEQWYLQEFNATDAPLGEKGAIVTFQA